MALLPDQKFSTFQVGGDLELGDIIVGLRGGINTQFTWSVPVSITSITGTANEVLVNGTSGSPVVGDVTLTLPQAIATTSSPKFAGITVPTIFDANNNNNVTFTTIPSAVNYLNISNNSTGFGPIISAVGSDTNINLGLDTKGSGLIFVDATGSSGPMMNIGTSIGRTILSFSSTTSSRTITFPDASGTLAFTSQITPVNTKYISTTPYNVLITDDIILVDTATLAEDSSIVLPAAPTRDGQVWTIKDFGFDASTYPITISVSGGGDIDGNTTYTLGSDNEAVSIAWSSAESTYTVVYSYPTTLPILAITANSGAANPAGGIVRLLGGTTGLTTSGSGNTINLTGVLIPANGGTGVNNGTSTITIGGNVAFSGAYTFTGTLTGNTSVTFPTSGTLATTAGTVSSVSGTANRITSTGGTTPVIDIAATYVGQTSLTTLGTIGTGTWQGTVIGSTYGGTGVNNGSSTITLGGSLTTSGAYASTFTMTNTTSVTFPTSGTLATTSQLVTPAALTKTDDTNVTLTLGGSPSTALVNAASLTLGWTGQLGLTRGGTNNSLTANNGGIVWSDASKLNILSGTATANQILLSGSNATPAWSTTTYPATNAINTIMYASSANVLGVITPVNSAVLISSSGGVPSMSTTLPSGIAATNMNLTTPTLGVASATSINFGGSALSVYAQSTSYTPTITFDTPGNLSVSYTTQTGVYSRIGNIVSAHFILSCTPTFTTASGNLRIVLPLTPSASGAGVLQFQASAFPAGTTSTFLQVSNGNTGMVVGVNGSLVATNYISTTQATSGGTLNMTGSVTFLV